MMRLLLAITLLVSGATAFVFLRSAGQPARAMASQFAQQHVETTSQLAACEQERDSIRASLAKLTAERREMLRERGLSPALSEWLWSGGTNQISGQAALDLKQELGLFWNTTGDFVWISKESVGQLRVAALTNGGLTETACSLLAISPIERSTVEETIQQIAAGNGQWLRSHLRRAEPAGEIVAQYEFPADFQQSQNLSNAVITGFTAALGAERAQILLKYADGPIQQQIGLMPNLKTTLMVRRLAEPGTAVFTYELRRNVSEDSLPIPGPRAGEVIGHTLESLERDRQRLIEIERHHELKRLLEHQGARESSQGLVNVESFPQVLLPAFPGGWQEIAQREGLELPEEFRQKAESP